jgi:hypothetical protein
MIRKLTVEDSIIFNQALDFYYENTDHSKSGFLSEDRKEWIEKHKEFFTSDFGDDYVVIGEIIDDIIVGLAIGFRNDFIIKRVNQNTLSGWHLAFTWRRKDIPEWASPKKFMFDITNPISLHMENLGIFDFTKIMRVNLGNAKSIGVDEYINRVYNKNIPDGRYNAYIEYIIESEIDIPNLPLLFRRHCPDKIITPLMCIRHSLKNELRSKYILGKLK